MRVCGHWPHRPIPDDLLEIIVVDDRSTDDTAARIDQWARRLPHLSRVSVTQQNCDCPKKNALWQGIKNARGDIIFTTDADCQPGPDWIASALAHFAPDVGMVIGHAPLLKSERAISGLLSPPGTHRLNARSGQRGHWVSAHLFGTQHGLSQNSL